MVKIGYLLAKLRSNFFKGQKKNEVVCSYFRKKGAHIGNNCRICSNLDLCEQSLLFIGNNTIISSGVTFVTHDASISIYLKKRKALFGKIIIGDNCFIGEKAMILYGVSIPDNTIVAAGSVVTKSILQNGQIIGGNPAKIIGTIDSFVSKNKEKVLSGVEINDISNIESLLIER